MSDKEKKLVALIKSLLFGLETAIDRSDLEDGDPFGVHHNDITDAMIEAEKVIAEAEGA